MIKEIYLFLHKGTLWFILFFVFALFVLTHSYFVPYLAKKYLPEYGVTYKNIEGNIFSGIKIRELGYGEFLKIEELKIGYSIFSLLSPTPAIRVIKTKNLELDIGKIPKSDDNATTTSIMAFAIKNIALEKTKIRVNNELYIFDATAKDLHYDEKINIEKLFVDSNTSYAHVTLYGKYIADRLKGNLSLSPSQNSKEQYLGFIHKIPKSIELQIDATQERVLVQTHLDSLSFKADENLSCKDMDAKFTYRVSQKLLEGILEYKLLYPEYEIALSESLEYRIDESYTTDINATLNKQAISLPFQSFTAHLEGDNKAFSSVVKAGSEYLISTNGNIKQKPLRVDGKIELNSPVAKIKGSYYFDEKELLLQADVNERLAHITLSKKGKDVNAFGDFASAKFQLQADLEKRKTADVNLHIASLKKFLERVELANMDDVRYQDGVADINATLTLAENVEIQSKVSMPWLAIKSDTQTTHLLKNISLEGKYKDKIITIEKYNAEYMEQKLYSHKESTLLLDKQGDIELQEFWIYDNLLAKGIIKPEESSGKINIHSDKFLYKAQDVNMTFSANIDTVLESNGTQMIDGNITLLDGVLSYFPVNDYKITDKDIVILQEMKNKEVSKLFLNLQLDTLQPIHYKTKEIDALFTSDLRVSQKPKEDMKLYGMVSLVEGKLKAADKEFVIDESYIYFNGEEEFNPKLNLHLHYYTLDYTDIEIFITNTLHEPVVIFSSKPAMSQDDIMSYILFGEPASTLFNSADGSNKTSINSLILGTGLKQMFSDSTGVNVDTLNIINSKDGTLGYEVGARFNKNIRLVYKSDTTSSVIVQYSISKSIRFDVDSHETGQGVAFTYVKDFALP